MADIYIYLFVLLTSTILVIANIDKDLPYLLLQKQVAVLMVITLMTEVSGLYLTELKIQNSYIYNLFVFFQFMYVSWLFYGVISSGSFRTIIRIFLALFPVIFLVNSLYFQNFVEVFQTNIFLLGSLFMVFLAISYFYFLMTEPSYAELNILQLPMFWLSTGMLFYFSGAFVWAIYLNFLIGEDYSLAGSISRITTILASLMYILFAIGFSCHKLFRTSPSS